MGWLKNWFTQRYVDPDLRVAVATSDAKNAVASAEKSLKLARAQTDEVVEVATQLRAIGERNHFAERIDIAWRRKETRA